jgi:hypothetical protein
MKSRMWDKGSCIDVSLLFVISYDVLFESLFLAMYFVFACFEFVNMFCKVSIILECVIYVVMF